MIQMLTQLRYTMISFRFNMCICTSVYKRPSKNEALAEIFMNDLVNDAKVRVNEVLRKSPQERQYKRWKWNPKSANYLLSHFINFFSSFFCTNQLKFYNETGIKLTSIRRIFFHYRFHYFVLLFERKNVYIPRILPTGHVWTRLTRRQFFTLFFR